MSARRGREFQELLSPLLFSFLLPLIAFLSCLQLFTHGSVCPCPAVLKRMHGDVRGQSRARVQVALAFGVHSLTSRLQSKCSKLVVCAKFSPGLYFVWPVQGVFLFCFVLFNNLKTFKNQENLGKKYTGVTQPPMPGNSWLELRAATLFDRPHLLHFVTVHTILATLHPCVPCLTSTHLSFQPLLD